MISEFSEDFDMSSEGVDPPPAAVMEPLDEIGAEEPTESLAVSGRWFSVKFIMIK